MTILSNAQVCAIAELERDFGMAQIIPPGPRRDRLMDEVGPALYDEDVLVQTGPGCLEPSVFLVSFTGKVLGKVE